MLGVFERQVRQGGSITITHPDVTHYVMTPEESVALTFQAGAIGEPGEILIHLRQPVRTVEVATRLAEQSPSPIGIVYTGLRRERTTGVAVRRGEADRRPIHPLIGQVPVPPLSFDDVRAACSVDGRLVLSAAAGDRRAVGTGRDQTTDADARGGR